MSGVTDGAAGRRPGGGAGNGAGIRERQPRAVPGPLICLGSFFVV